MISTLISVDRFGNLDPISDCRPAAQPALSINASREAAKLNGLS
jgi:hypothetical protein